MKQLLCTFVMTTSLMASLNANAGLFDSKPELDCGSESGKKAFTQYVRDDVTSVLQTNYIIAAPVFYKKPLEQFIDTLNGINITISGSRIDSQRSPSDISCTANVSFVVPEKTIDVFKRYRRN